MLRVYAGPPCLPSQFLKRRRSLLHATQRTALPDVIFDLVMPILKSKRPIIKTLQEVGRYAIGIVWNDGHDSIFPLENLRRACPCDICKGYVKGAIPETGQRV